MTSGSISEASLTDGAGLSWFGLNGTGLSGTLTIPGVAASVANLSVQVNQAKGTGATAIDWTTVTGSGLSLAGSLLKAEGDLTSLDVFGLLSGSAHFAISKTLVTLTSPAVTNQPLLTVALSNLQLAVGAAGYGLQITSGSINAASLTDGAGLSWFGLNGNGLSGSLTIPGVGASVANLSVQVNQAKGTGATAIDWTTVTCSRPSLAGSRPKAEGGLTRPAVLG